MKLPPPYIYRDLVSAPPTGRQGVPSPAGGNDFKRMLSQTGDPSSGLSQQIAEVFNAHGFFPRESGASPSEELVHDSVGETVDHRSWPLSYPPLNRSSPTVIDESDLAAGTSLDRDPGTPSPLQSMAENGPTQRAATASPVPAQSGVLSTPQSIPTAMAPPTDSRDDRTTKVPGPPVSRPIARPMSSPSDRLTFAIGPETLVLAGRLSALDPDERQRLFDALETVLGEHGLRLGDATINGQTFSPASRSPR